jgi:hypothetical protein
MEEELRDTLTEGYGNEDVADRAATYSPKAFAFCLEQGELGTPGAVDDFGNPTEICLMTYDS